MFDARIKIEGTEMKKISTLVVCLLLVSFVFAGLPAVSRLAEPKIISAQEGPDRLDDLLTVVAARVSEMPTIDGDVSDPAWEGAKITRVGGTAWSAVYTDDELAMYIRWIDHQASVNSRGTWNWDPDTQSWWRTGWEPGTWRPLDGLTQTENLRVTEWFNIAWDISTDLSTAPISETGCGSFCHESADGSGEMHHQTNAMGAYVDSWMILAKHGFGAGSLHDMGWIQGVSGVSQEGELIFNPSDPMDPRQVINGSLTFLGYAEDKVMGSPDDPKFADRNTPADRYCLRCHDQLGMPDPLKVNFTYGDLGDIMYSENWSDDQSVPLYMELAPENFIDCIVLTQAEIDAGEAVLIADLSEAEFAAAWNNYAALNGNIPHLILQEPSGSQADVRVGANWYNGVWTVELRRKLVTGNEDDVQFDDLSKDYHFAVTLTATSSAVGGVQNTGWTLRFEQ
ncbi:MAG: hypothetical protein LC121_04145 [Anaerolineae bacterium]|nr:hypothetical protein [Anaerolineae bacterium]